jgi:hypothetical protein
MIIIYKLFFGLAGVSLVVVLGAIFKTYFVKE